MSDPYFLRSARLGFRTWTDADLPLALALWTDPEVMRYLGGTSTPAMAEQRMRSEMDRQQRLGVQYWPIFDLATGEHAGCAGLRTFHTDESRYEVGVHIGRAFWSGRYGEEAARAVIRYGFEQLQLPALMAGHHRDNLHSRALINRLGFSCEGEELWGPMQMPAVFYSLQRSEWQRSADTSLG